MRDCMTEALKASDADYADMRIEDRTDSWVLFRGEELDSIGSSRTVGGVARALYRGGWGYCTFNDLDHLEKRVREACEGASLVGTDRTSFAQVDPVVDSTAARLVKDHRHVPLAEKKALMGEYNRIILGHHASIQTSTVYYSDSFRTIRFANTEGTYTEEEVPDVHLMANAVARRGDVVQSGAEMGGGADGYQSVEGFHEKARQAAQRAVDLLSAPSVTGGSYTVVTDPYMSGVFAHEAFGHLSEADFVHENPRMKDLMVLGRRFGSPGLTIVDDGSMPGGLGTHRYDFEGVPTGRNYLIKDGILVGRLHSRETAARMDEPVTGNARAVAFQDPPIVRMTNTYIEPRDAAFADIIKDIRHGVYALSMVGGQTAMEMFTFSAGYGYMIRDGCVAELVRDVVLTGNVFETLEGIDMIGSDLKFQPNGPGGCGKGGQAPLRVGIGGPHLRIQSCVVGGRQ